jgi:hypothetical protein
MAMWGVTKRCIFAVDFDFWCGPKIVRFLSFALVSWSVMLIDHDRTTA